MILTAPLLLAGPGKVLKNASLLVRNGRIAALGPRQEIKAEYSDKEELELVKTLLCPGFINAHAHTEFTRLKEDPPKDASKGRSFTSWVRTQVSSPEAVSRPQNTRKGLELLLEGGTSTVLDHLNPSEDLAAYFPQHPLRRLVFLEIVGAQDERAYRGYQKALELFTKHHDDGRIAGLTPHSLYGLHPSLIKVIMDRAEATALFPIHMLESSEEQLFFEKDEGPMKHFVEAQGGSYFTQGQSPLAWLQSHKLLNDKIIVVHGNYLQADEIERLKKFKAGIVHCPGSHAYFGHRRFPLEEIQKAGISVALGTDSLASNTSLNMLDEMRQLKREYPTLGDEAVFEMATLSGARLLKRERDLGSLEVGKIADVVGFEIQGKTAYDTLFQSERTNFVMIEGEIIRGAFHR